MFYTMGDMKQDLVYELLNFLPAGVMLADDSGNIVFANNAAIEYLGIGREGLKEINIDHLLQNSTKKKEIMLRTRGEERIRVHLSNNVLSNGWTVIVLKDITEVHQLQQELLKMDKLASVGELTSGIAHEIRNPLAGIKTTAQALSEEIPPQDHRSVYISKIIMEIDRLNKLLLNFFDFAKPKALSIRAFDVKRVIENTIYMVKDIARSNRVQIMEFYPTDTIRIHADPDMIQQVLMNIFINAVQSMPAGGRMEVHLLEKDSNIVIEVSDTGKGIPDNIRSRIFDPFFTTKPKGIGLGLSISYRIIKMHSGGISFTSSDQGTKFSIVLSKDNKG